MFDYQLNHILSLTKYDMKVIDIIWRSDVLGTWHINDKPTNMENGHQGAYWPPLMTHRELHPFSWDTLLRSVFMRVCVCAHICVSPCILTSFQIHAGFLSTRHCVTWLPFVPLCLHGRHLLLLFFARKKDAVPLKAAAVSASVRGWWSLDGTAGITHGYKLDHRS